MVERAADQGAVRVSDAEREQAAARLLAAHGEGRLTLVEYDERVVAAHAALVRDDLTPLLADLPTAAGRTDRSGPTRRARSTSPRGYRPPVPWPGPAALATGASPCGRGAVAVWAAASLLNVVIWLAVSAGTATAVYPWWIWVAGPWGVMLALGRLAERTGSAGRGRPGLRS